MSALTDYADPQPDGCLQGMHAGSARIAIMLEEEWAHLKLQEETTWTLFRSLENEILPGLKQTRPPYAGIRELAGDGCLVDESSHNMLVLTTNLCTSTDRSSGFRKHPSGVKPSIQMTGCCSSAMYFGR